MTAVENLIEPAQLQEQLLYCPETGQIRWRHRYGGRPALATPHAEGYLAGCVSRRVLLAHRVAWALFHGEWPKNEIDHINGNRRDNRIVNMRDVSHHLNQRNRKRRSDNTSGVDGVSWCRAARSWKVTIGRTYLGLFKEFTAAVSARHAAQVELGYHPNHGRAANSSCNEKPNGLISAAA